MTSDDITAIAEKHGEEFLKFEHVPEDARRHKRPDLAGMLLLAERFDGTSDIVSSAVHDEIYFNALPDNNDNWPVSEDDIVYLLRCGIRWDDDIRAFASFV